MMANGTSILADLCNDSLEKVNALIFKGGGGVNILGVAVHAVLRGLAYNGKKRKVKKSTGALSYPRPLVKRSSEQFLFLL